MDVKPGDTIEIQSNKVGQPVRRGVVERVIEAEPLRLEVRWDEGNVSEFVPAAGNVRVRQRSS